MTLQLQKTTCNSSGRCSVSVLRSVVSTLPFSQLKLSFLGWISLLFFSNSYPIVLTRLYYPFPDTRDPEKCSSI